MVRLYVGGLPSEIAAKDVIGRFAPFGSVGGCELVATKGLDAAPRVCRGFAYVDMQPKDEISLKRCLSLVRDVARSSKHRSRRMARDACSPRDSCRPCSFPQYNGCKWRGHTLRVEVAKPHYLQQLEAEREAEVEEEAAAAAAAAEKAAAPPELPPPPAPGAQLRIHANTRRGKVR